MPDNGVSNNYSIAFRLAKRGEAVPGGDLENWGWWRGRSPGPRPGSRLPLLKHPGFMVCQLRSEGGLG